MKNIIFIFLLLISCIDSSTQFVTSASSSTVGTTYYIDENGSNGDDGSRGSPWLTLVYACAQVTISGEVIHVNAGTYDEGTNRCDLAVGVSLEGEGDVSIIKSTYYLDGYGAVTLNSAAGAPVDGNQSISYLKFDGDNQAGYVAVMSRFRNNVTVHHCTFVDWHYIAINIMTQSCYLSPPANWATGNKVHDCIINDCSSRDPRQEGSVTASGQIDFLFYNNNLTQTSEPAGYNGNIVCTNYMRGFKTYDNVFTKNDSDGSAWHFFFENWHYEGGCEIYDNTFNGAAVLDVVDVIKGSYDYGLKIYDNDFLVENSIPKGTRQIQAIDLEERGYIQDVYIYNNYFKNFPYGIELYITADEQDTYFNDIYIYYNIFENIGYTDYNWTYGIWLNCDPYAQSYAQYIDNINIWNNVITEVDNTTTGNKGIVFRVGGTVTNISIRNNIIQDWQQYAIRFYSGWTHTVDTVSVENNLYYQNGQNSLSVDGGVTMTNLTNQNNITDNPDFTVPGSNFHLQTGAPGLDQGLDVGLSTDYEEVAVDASPNIGVYETIEDP